MTWTTLKASGSGKIAIYVQIAGIAEVFATGNAPTPDGTTGSWYTSGGHTAVRHWLEWRGVTLDERVSFMDGSLDVAPISFDVVDTDGQFTALCKSWLSWQRTRLAADLTATEADTMTVGSTSNFQSTDGVIWVGSEAIGYATVDDTHFLTLTRGKYGTIAQAHDVDLARRPVPVLPSVLNGPQSLVGRRVYVWAGDVVDGALSGATECIYRGYVTPDSEAGAGKWRINVEHICQWFTRRVGAEMPVVDLKPGYYFGDAIVTNTRIWVEEYNMSTGAVTAAGYASVAAGYYSSAFSLAQAVYDALVTATSAFNRLGPRAMVGDDDMLVLYSPASDTYRQRLIVAENDPLNVLGFDPGDYTFGNENEASIIEASNDPDRFAMVWRLGCTANPWCYVSDNTRLTDEAYCVLGKTSPWLKIDALDAGGSKVTFDQHDTVRLGTPESLASGIGNLVIRIEKDEDLVLRHAIVVNESIDDVLKQLTHTATSQVEPEGWCVKGLQSSDILWTELTTALVGASPELQQVTDCIVEPIELDKFLLPRFALLCIAPRITTNGAIGFAKLKVPNEREASSIEVNSAVWSQMQAAEMKTQTGGDPLVNQIILGHSYNYRDGKWAPDYTITYDDGVNMLGKTMAHKFELRGMLVGRLSSVFFRTAEDLGQIVSYSAMGLHFGLYGRQASKVTIPCTWKAKQLNIGDIVSITHPTLVDVELGTVGVTSRLGIITGRIGAVTDNAPDSLIVLLPAQRNVAGWAPAALGTSWNSGTTTLTFAATDAFAQSGASDLDGFAIGDYVRIELWNSEAPTVYTAATVITGKSSSTLVLGLDPFADDGGFPESPSKVLVTLPKYTNANITATQKQWLFNGDENFKLDADAAYVWAP